MYIYVYVLCIYVYTLIYICMYYVYIYPLISLDTSTGDFFISIKLIVVRYHFSMQQLVNEVVVN